MTIQQVKEFFMDKEHVPCPLTEKLVKAGYQQKSGGYIARARKEGIVVDYTQNSPSQYWHLMTYCESRDGNKTFSKSIVCGELIFWMAEVSSAVDCSTLEQLVDQIIESADYSKGNRPIYDRGKWNHIIHYVCFERIFAISYPEPVPIPPKEEIVEVKKEQFEYDKQDVGDDEEVNISRDDAIEILHKIGVKTNGKTEKEIDTLIIENLGLHFNEEPIDYIPMPSLI